MQSQSNRSPWAKVIAKGIIGLAVLAALPAAAAILGGKEPIVLRPAHLVEVAEQTSIHEKDQSRIPVSPAATNEFAKSGSFIQLAQAHLAEGGRMPPALSGGPPPLPLPVPPFPPAERPEVWSSRTSHALCGEEVSRKSALVGYVKSKLRLQEPQRDAWQRLEQAAHAAIERLHAACDQLPTDASGPPNVVDTIDVAVRRLSADVEFLQAMREPLRGLYEQLSREQRLMLQPLGLPGFAF